MGRWPIKPLGELLVTLESGSRPKGGVGEIPSGIPSLGGEHINRNGGFVWETPKHITREFYAGMKRGRIQRGDILVVKDGATTGKTATVRNSFPFREAAINEHVFLLRTDKAKALPEFVGYFLFGPVGQQQILSNFHGAAIGGIAQDFVRSVYVPLAPLAEQERLVELLDEVDELRRLRAQADHRAAALIPALYHEMFGEPTRNTRNWRRELFGDVLDAIDGGWSPTCHDRPAQEGEWGVLKLGAVTTCRYIDNENKALPEDVAPRPELEVKAGDLLFTRKNTYGLVAACSLVLETRPKLMLSDLIFRFRLKPSVQLNPIYLWGLLTVPSKRKQVQSLAGGSAGSMPNISKGRLLTLPIEVPPPLLQKEFAKRVTEIGGLEAEQAASRRRLDALFQSMLHRAFAGQL
jgi:type I restriction enzyme S subunit